MRETTDSSAGDTTDGSEPSDWRMDRSGSQIKHVRYNANQDHRLDKTSQPAFVLR